VTRSRFLLREPDPASRARIYAIPYSGAGASMYKDWPRFLDGVEICPVHLPGRERLAAEPHYGDYRALAAVLAAELAPYAGPPAAFFGHCSSALIGYETGRALWSGHGIGTGQLFVSSEAPPHLSPYGRIFKLDERGLAEEVSESLGHPAGKFGERLTEMVTTALVADVAANRSYHAQPPAAPGGEGISGITVLVWSDDAQFPLEVQEGWTAYAPTQFASLAGGHHAFRSFPPGLADVLTAPFAVRHG